MESINKKLEYLDSQLTIHGYKKFNQRVDNETFAYWKISECGNYQTGVLVYDYREFGEERFAKVFKCVLLDVDGVEMKINTKIDIYLFEKIADNFYKNIKNYV